jgi:hypothetical protein
MRTDLSAWRVRRVQLIAYAGKQLKAAIPNNDSAGAPEDLTGYTAFGKIVDHEGTLVLDLAPTCGEALGTFILNVLIPAETAPGWYRWRGGFDSDSTGEDVRYEGPVHIRSY